MIRKIWTVWSTDMIDGENVADTAAIESYGTKEAAAEGCAQYFLERLEVRPDIRYAVGHDACHPHVVDDIHRDTGIPAEAIRAMFASATTIGGRNVKAEASLRSIVKEEILGEESYLVATGADSDIGECTFQFGIDSNFLND